MGGFTVGEDPPRASSVSWGHVLGIAHPLHSQPPPRSFKPWGWGWGCCGFRRHAQQERMRGCPLLDSNPQTRQSLQQTHARLTRSKLACLCLVSSRQAPKRWIQSPVQPSPCLIDVPTHHVTTCLSIPKRFRSCFLKYDSLFRWAAMRLLR